jgi:predicted PolB exonuclease-like 3'-5' exonuclease
MNNNFTTIALDKILFLDIETVPQYPDFDGLDDDFKYLWDKKSTFFRKDSETAADVYSRAGIYAEFGKIICISVGMVSIRDEQTHLRIKSFYGKEEKDILLNFSKLVAKLKKMRKEIYLCAHNGKEFDFPFIARRMLVNQIVIPEVLQVAGRRPWEVNFLDTLELWKFGDYKNFTSLELLTKIFGISSPKDDIDGSMVAGVYYKENDLKRIVTYCEKDTRALTQLFLSYRSEPHILDENIESVTEWI